MVEHFKMIYKIKRERYTIINVHNRNKNKHQPSTNTNKQTNKQKTPFDLKINKIKHIGHELQQKIDEQCILFRQK
jgi:hypothetical protein